MKIIFEIKQKIYINIIMMIIIIIITIIIII